MDSPTKFSLDIENLKINSPDVSYIEIIREYIEDNDIDYHVVPSLLTLSLKQKMEVEASRLFLIDLPNEHYSMDELL